MPSAKWTGGGGPACPPFSGTAETSTAQHNRRRTNRHRGECCSNSKVFERVDLNCSYDRRKSNGHRRRDYFLHRHFHKHPNGSSNLLALNLSLVSKDNLLC